ncbi:DNA-binding response regulator [Pseudoclavibacter sp. RFBJ3]|uniref:response regulator n=1 Tax=unclassified Pseudoclavibacter TaxID=2615177 RepID=UPI000CE7B3F3|nr:MULTISPECIES: response regulator transcription factor [unclassified Pseudoclavibacter]PPF81471.1 DNA-binding response regulator [Pseudoclavibacter sp. RFBJ5]PPF90802.1 DNA-binding response regulator [Pseudoclavibacter sp. RFBJ3]PPG00078.1 DNA-binding response regulator [Pseudoclavibacter sp. RFBH5]PPG19935.1 DNA-binding response regulator [Pseudoclavibacter sp. RFBI4]
MVNPDSIRVLIVDDEAGIRLGLRLLIDGAEGIRVVGEGTNGEEALALAAEQHADVILMDVRMPGLTGIDAVERLTASGSRAKVVMLTAFDTEEFLLDALRAGAVSFLLKDAPPEDIVGAVLDAARGKAVFSPSALDRLVRAAANGSKDGAHHRGSGGGQRPARDARGDELLASVTSREREIARYVAQGMTNAEIAAALYVSQATVKTHLASLFSKVHVTNRVQLALLTLEWDAAGRV